MWSQVRILSSRHKESERNRAKSDVAFALVFCLSFTQRTFNLNTMINIIEAKPLDNNILRVDEFKNIFDWVDANSIRERILILSKSILWGQVCIIEINGDSKTITEHPPFTR